MRGKDYNDPLWDDLINEISFKFDDNKSPIGKLLGYGAYNIAKLDAIGKISTIDFDVPLGFSTFNLKKDYKWCNYISQILLGCNFNPV